MKNTMTQAIALSYAINFINENGGDPTVSAKLETMVTTLANKKSTPSKADREKQELNATIRNEIVATLTAENRLVTIKEMQTLNENLSEYSNQKMSAMLKALVDNGTIVKTIDKKITYFSMA